jgi:stage IV sporulation protein B
MKPRIAGTLVKRHRNQFQNKEVPLMKRNLRPITAAVLLCALLCALLLCPAHAQASTCATDHSLPAALIPGGYPFGVKFTTQGVLVVGFRDISLQDAKGCNPAREAGLKCKDVLIALDGEAIDSAKALAECIEKCGGRPIRITYLRGDSEQQLTLTPVMDENGSWRTGLYVRDSGAGIGTLTYIDPQTMQFGGLGHGICDVDTGELMPLKNGSVVGVTISGIKRGAAGDPGEIKGYFHTDKLGSLRKNCACGVFGALRELPAGAQGTELPLGRRDQLHTGEAEILCTLTSGERRSYAITISTIDRDATGSKCFAIEVTDPALLEETGGIVQGMSGSPVIQDGKLVGAVTHVLVADPARGYGIFIENMLDAAG